MFNDYQRACLELGRYISQFLRNEVPEGSALGFSGGIDSSLLLYLSTGKLIPYNVSILGSRDNMNASRVAGALGIKFTHIDLQKVDVKKYLGIIHDIDPSISRADIGYELILAILLGSVHEEYVVTGQGSDEIFYGYRRFTDDPFLTNVGHIEKLFNITLPRETKLADYFGKKLLTPYLQHEIMELAASFQRSDHIDAAGNKKVLRQAARLMGYPEELSDMPKKAAQYGSGIMKILHSLQD